MSLSLAQAAVLSTDDLQRGVLETFVQESGILDRIPMLPIEGNAYAYNAEESLPGVAFRAVNGSYPESTGTVVQRTETLAILGGDADVDRFLVQTRGNLQDQRAIQTRMKVKVASAFYQDAFINGGSDADTSLTDGHVPEGNAAALAEAKRTGDAATAGFDGLATRLTGDQVFDAEGRGLETVTDEAAVHEFFDLLDEAVGKVPGVNGSNGAVYTNRALISKIVSAGRRIGGVEWIKEDMTGKRVVTWNGIPFIDLGQRMGAGTDGGDIIPLTDGEEGARSTDLYVVKFGRNEADGGVTGLTNGGVQVRDLGELDSKPVFRTRLEFYCGLATFGGQAAARVQGVAV